MLISLNWIRQFCPFESTDEPAALASRFSLHTAEVERVERVGQALGGVVAARVLDVRPHPNADRLRLARVDAGGAAPVEVVCGAPNVAEGLLVPFAAPGTAVGGQVLQVAKVRGVLSHGMLCSARELEVGSDASGLWVLGEEAAPGASLASLYPELVDTILEVDNKSLTHRPDLWGHHGLAREFSAIYATPLRPLEVDRALAQAEGTARVRVSLEGEGVSGARGLCRRYLGLQVDGVKVGPSPAWLRHRLELLGSRPVSNIVDITNYILFECGQPLHAFDAAAIRGGRIIVRRARDGEPMRLLDQKDIRLQAEDLVIADAQGPVALAGIMGGDGSQISDGTTSLFLESANFAPARVRRTSVRIGTRTDSSLRFEKSLDPEMARTAILRAAALVLEVCPGARVTGKLQDVGFEPPAPIVIETSPAFLQRRLGADLPARSLRASLERLGFEVDGEEEGAWKVRVPSWRATKDVSIAEDLVEEVGRIHGYDRIRPFAPASSGEAVGVNEHRLFERRAKRFLTLHGGLTEAFTYSMVGRAHCELFGIDPAAPIALRNPITEDMDRMRTEIVPIHLEKARENQRFRDRFGFFELGRVYRRCPGASPEDPLPEERSRLAALLAFPEKSPAHFHEARSLVLALLDHLRVPGVSVEPLEDGVHASPPWAHPTVHARLTSGGEERGRLYRVHPGIEQRLDLKGDVLVFDLDFDGLHEGPRRPITYAPPQRYPTVPFDVAVVAPRRTPVRAMEEVIRGAAGAWLQSLSVFDVFEDARLGEDRKSVAFHLVLGSSERTLSAEERTGAEAAVVAALARAGFPLR